MTPDKILQALKTCSYGKETTKEVFEFLKLKETFSFSPLPNGLFPAAHLANDAEYTGYSNVWVRDNIHVANAFYVNGDTETATKNVTTIADYFIKHRWRFEKIISGALDCSDPMNRPHIRFDGNTLSEIPQKWSHAQNDALGDLATLLWTPGLLSGLSPFEIPGG